VIENEKLNASVRRTIGTQQRLKWAKPPTMQQRVLRRRLQPPDASWRTALEKRVKAGKRKKEKTAKKPASLANSPCGVLVLPITVCA
jgi:hypothetical protein